jgi:predicted DCC family thiol-disulfide oxidoreductase YuxK
MPLPAPTPSLTPDCTNCAALCCVLLAFDASTAFAEDKPACAPCRHLSADHRCRIHADLSQLGYTGCAAYTCHGAGQRITSQVFKGRDWRKDSTLLPAMEAAFRALRRLHEAAWLLQQASRLPLPQPTQDECHNLLAGLNLGQSWDENGLAAAEQGQSLRAVRPFLASLRDLPGLTPPRR